jgi:hypothetical protein
MHQSTHLRICLRHLQFSLRSSEFSVTMRGMRARHKLVRMRSAIDHQQRPSTPLTHFTNFFLGKIRADRSIDPDEEGLFRMAWPAIAETHTGNLSTNPIPIWDLTLQTLINCQLGGFPSTVPLHTMKYVSFVHTSIADSTHEQASRPCGDSLGTRHTWLP